MPAVQLPPVQRPAPNPRDYAIVVGIDHYTQGILALNGAINDCELFCRWLTDPNMGGLDSANITFFRSVFGSPEPIRNQIEDRLAQFFEEADQSGQPCGRRLYLFFAGHGLVPPPPDASGCALVMADARATLLRGLLGYRAANAMRLTGLFQEVMLVMDCCAEVSGQSELACFLPRYGDPTLAARPYTHIQAAQWGASTAERQLDNPLDPAAPPLWHGVLTNALLRGLTTAADANGVVTAASLKQFLEATEAGGLVVEHSNGTVDAVMTFGTAVGLLVEAILTEGATRFQIREGNNFSVVIPARSAGPVRLAPGQYLFDALDPQGAVTKSVPVSVREGGVHVQL